MTSQIPISGLKQQVAVAGGSSNAPSISFLNDTNMGLYRVGEDVLGVATGGVERVRVDASGTVRVTGNMTLTGSVLPKYKVHDGIVYDPAICDGTTSDRAGISALQLLLDGYGAAGQSGLKWLKCDGYTTQQIYCDFDTAGGPWTIPMFDLGAANLSSLQYFKAFFVTRGIPNAGRGAGQTVYSWMAVKRMIAATNDPAYAFVGTRGSGPILTMPFYRTGTAGFLQEWIEVLSNAPLREIPNNITGDRMDSGETFGGWWNFADTTVVNSWRDTNYTTNFPDPEDWSWGNYPDSYNGIPKRICGIFR